MREIFKKKKYKYNSIYGKDQKILILLSVSIACSAILFLIGFLIFLGTITIAGNILTGMDFIVFGLLTSIGPIGFYNHIKEKRKKQVEEHLPDFLREISSSTASGMTIFDAIKSAAAGDHGPLTTELELMASQLSWGIKVSESLNNFAKRINTPAVKRMAVTVNKALEIGGNTSAVFEAAAKEIDQVKLVEEQRKAEMSMYAIVIFISFAVFLAVIVIINNTIIAEFISVQEKLSVESQNVGGQAIQIAEVDPFAIKNIFLSFILVQSVGGGLLGGFMMDGKLSSGVRYGFILILVSFFVFKLLF